MWPDVASGRLVHHSNRQILMGSRSEAKHGYVHSNVHPNVEPY